jgi:hypothetical protein
VTGRGKTSGVPIEVRVVHIRTVRDGLAVRLAIYDDRGRALAAR